MNDIIDDESSGGSDKELPSNGNISGVDGKVPTRGIFSKFFKWIYPNLSTIIVSVGVFTTVLIYLHSVEVRDARNQLLNSMEFRIEKLFSFRSEYFKYERRLAYLRSPTAKRQNPVKFSQGQTHEARKLIQSIHAEVKTIVEFLNAYQGVGKELFDDSEQYDKAFEDLNAAVSSMDTKLSKFTKCLNEASLCSEDFSSPIYNFNSDFKTILHSMTEIKKLEVRSPFLYMLSSS